MTLRIPNTLGELTFRSLKVCCDLSSIQGLLHNQIKVNLFHKPAMSKRYPHRLESERFHDTILHVKLV